MARYIPIHQELLEDPEFAELSRDAKIGWLALRLDTRIGKSGVGRMTERSIIHILGGGQVGRRVLDELVECSGGIGIVFDGSSGIVWIRGAFGCDHSLRNADSHKSVVRELGKLPRGKVLDGWIAQYRGSILGESRQAVDTLSTGCRQEGPPILFRSGSDPERNGTELRGEGRGMQGGVFPTRSLDPDSPSTRSLGSIAADGAPPPLRFSREDPPEPDHEPDSPTDRDSAEPATAASADDFGVAWNTLTSPPICRVRIPFGQHRRKRIARLRRADPEFETRFPEVCRRIQASGFCRGETGAQPRPVSFSWIVNHDDTWRRVLEGEFDDLPSAAGSNGHRPEWTPPDHEPEHAHLVEIVRRGQPRPDELSPSELATWRKLVEHWQVNS